MAGQAGGQGKAVRERLSLKFDGVRRVPGCDQCLSSAAAD